MSTTSISLQDIWRARAAIAGHIRRTLLVPSPALSTAAGADIWLKLETQQDTGSFKLRGATNKLRSLSEEARAKGVVAVSTGNHGRGVATAAARLGVRCVVFMSELVPDNKRRAIEDAGAEIRIVGKSQDEAEIDAQELVAADRMTMIHPFDDAHVAAGQGTIGLELLEDLPDIAAAVVPLSGGGLIGGIAYALKAASPDIRVAGVSMDRGPAMVESLKAGMPVPVEEEASLADSLGGGIGLENKLTFALVRDHVDDTVLVSEDEIARAMTWLFRNEGIVAEGGAAVGVAALLAGKLSLPAGPVVLVISGRNIDMARFHEIVAEA